VFRVGEVRVLFVSVSAPARVLRVPVTGRVTLVFAVRVRPREKLPENVRVFAALLATPVPPFTGATAPVRAPVGRLVKVLEEPDIDLFVKVWVLAAPTRITDADTSGGS
jgi:hypothetical protein